MKRESSNTTNSLAHTRWNCKYHIMFAPKYRRKVFYEDQRLEIREILRKLCEWKVSKDNRGRGVSRITCICLVSDPAQNERFGVYGVFERKKCTLIFQKWGNMKFAYRNREFWCKGYYVDTAGKNTKTIKEYIANQLKQDSVIAF